MSFNPTLGRSSWIALHLVILSSLSGRWALRTDESVAVFAADLDFTSPFLQQDCYVSLVGVAGKVAADEGNDLGSATTSDPKGCEEQCDGLERCESFAKCAVPDEKSWRCYFKDKALEHDAPSVEVGNGCETFRKVNCEAAETKQCVDTPGWENNFGYTCTDLQPMARLSYVSQGWCADGSFTSKFQWTGGSRYNFPEHNCCACGKDKDAAQRMKRKIISAKSSLSPQQAASFEYVGCFANEDVDRVASHVNGLSVADCASKATIAGSAYFGLEFPQGFDTPGHVACLTMAAYPSMRQVGDHQCEGDGDIYKGYHLGSGQRLAVYTFKSGVFSLQHYGGRCIRPHRHRHGSDETQTVLFDGCGGDHPDSRFKMLPAKNGYFLVQHRATGMCFSPKTNTENPSNGDDLVLNQRCDSGEKSMLFKMLPGSGARRILQHYGGKCVHPEPGSDHPANDGQLVIHEGCGADIRALYFTLVNFDVEDDGGKAKALSEFRARHAADGTAAEGEIALRHWGGKCVSLRGGVHEPVDNVPLVVFAGCSLHGSSQGSSPPLKLTQQAARDEYFLIRTRKGKCVRPANTDTPHELVLSGDCGKDNTDLFFKKVASQDGHFNLQHYSGRCVRPESGTDMPKNDVKLVLNEGCGSDLFTLFFRAVDPATEVHERIPVRDGCYTIKDRRDCCFHVDGRSNFYGGSDCVPARLDMAFISGNVCEPQCWVSNTCDRGPHNQQSYRGTCQGVVANNEEINGLHEEEMYWRDYKNSNHHHHDLNYSHHHNYSDHHNYSQHHEHHEHHEHRDDHENYGHEQHEHRERHEKHEDYDHEKETGLSHDLREDGENTANTVKPVSLNASFSAATGPHHDLREEGADDEYGVTGEDGSTSESAPTDDEIKIFKVQAPAPAAAPGSTSADPLQIWVTVRKKKNGTETQQVPSAGVAGYDMNFSASQPPAALLDAVKASALAEAGGPSAFIEQAADDIEQAADDIDQPAPLDIEQTADEQQAPVDIIEQAADDQQAPIDIIEQAADDQQAPIDSEVGQPRIHPCSLAIPSGSLVMISSHRGEFLQTGEGVDADHGINMKLWREGNGAIWTVDGTSDGRVVLTSGDNRTLQDRPDFYSHAAVGILSAPIVKLPNMWEQWGVFTDGEDCRDVILASHENRYLQDREGEPVLSGNPGQWERWRITALDGAAAFKPVETGVENSSSVDLEQCPIFYQTAEGVGQGQESVRQQTVRQMMETYPQIRKMSSIYYTRDWDALTGMFKALQLPVNLSAFGDCCGPDSKRHTKGQVAKWATLLLGAVWQKRFQAPCMILMEDDIKLPPNFQARLATLASRLPKDEPRMLKFGRFAEGYVFNLAAAEFFLRRVYERGIDEWCDLWTDREMHGLLHQVDVGISLTVYTGGGNIWKTDSAEDIDFNYSASHNLTDLAPLENAFATEDSEGSSVDLPAAASRVTATTTMTPWSTNSAGDIFNDSDSHDVADLGPLENIFAAQDSEGGSVDSPAAASRVPDMTPPKILTPPKPPPRPPSPSPAPDPGASPAPAEPSAAGMSTPSPGQSTAAIQLAAIQQDEDERPQTAFDYQQSRDPVSLGPALLAFSPHHSENHVDLADVAARIAKST